jgi:hypothetical protein
LPATELDDLASLENKVVTVGGSVIAIDGARLLVDDGSASAFIRLVGEAATQIDDIEIGDLINATGTVELNDQGDIEVVVSERGSISKLHPNGPTSSASSLPLSDIVPGPHTPPADGPTTSAPATGAAVAILVVALMVLAAVLIGGRARRDALRARLQSAIDRLRGRARKLVDARPRI